MNSRPNCGTQTALAEREIFIADRKAASSLAYRIDRRARLDASLHLFNASFKALAGVNASFLAAATLMVAPVAGLRASRPALLSL